MAIQPRTAKDREVRWGQMNDDYRRRHRTWVWTFMPSHGGRTVGAVRTMGRGLQRDARCADPATCEGDTREDGENETQPANGTKQSVVTADGNSHAIRHRGARSLYGRDAVPDGVQVGGQKRSYETCPRGWGCKDGACDAAEMRARAARRRVPLIQSQLPFDDWLKFDHWKGQWHVEASEHLPSERIHCLACYAYASRVRRKARGLDG